MESTTTTAEPGRLGDQVYDPQIIGISTEDASQAGDEVIESLKKLRDLNKATKIAGEDGLGNEDEAAAISQPASQPRMPSQQDQAGESTYALMALSSLASLGSLPPVPNLGGSTVTHEGSGVGTEASGSGSGSMVAGQIVDLAGQDGDHLMEGYPARTLPEPLNDGYNNDTSDQLDNLGDTTRRSRSGRGRGRKRKQDERGSVGEPGTTGGSGGDELEAMDGQGQSGGGGNGNGNGEGGKRLKRAEQNRLAQQTFRKRREERMKQLEEKTKEMERLNEAVDEGRRRVGEVELENEALRMENQLLRDIVHSLSRAAGPSQNVLDDRGDFILLESDTADRNVDVQMENAEEAMARERVATPNLELPMQDSAPTSAREPGMDTEDEVVRNLLNVSNELNAAAANANETAQDDRIAVALERLRARSRDMVQTADLKRRQALIQQAALRETQEAALRWEAEAAKESVAQRRLEEEDRAAQSEYEATPRKQIDLSAAARSGSASSPKNRHVSVSEARDHVLVEPGRPSRMPSQYPEQRSPSPSKETERRHGGMDTAIVPTGSS